jgi:predicted transcriptional regulator
MNEFNEPNARSTDPETSHGAAEDASFRASKHRVLALKTLDRFGPLTDFELASRTGLQQTSIGKRRKECQDAGLVANLFTPEGTKAKRPAPSGSNALVWTLTPEGILYVKANCLVIQ